MQENELSYYISREYPSKKEITKTKSNRQQFIWCGKNREKTCHNSKKSQPNKYPYQLERLLFSKVYIQSKKKLHRTLPPLGYPVHSLDLHNKV